MGFFRKAFVLVKGVLRATFVADRPAALAVARMPGSFDTADVESASPSGSAAAGSTPSVLAPVCATFSKRPSGQKKRVRFEVEEQHESFPSRSKKPRVRTDEEVTANIWRMLARMEEKERKTAEWRKARRQSKWDELTADWARQDAEEIERALAEEKKQKEDLKKAEEAGVALFATLQMYREHEAAMRVRKMAEMELAMQHQAEQQMLQQMQMQQMEHLQQMQQTQQMIAPPAPVQATPATPAFDFDQIGCIFYHALPAELKDTTSMPGFQSIPGLVDATDNGIIVIDHCAYGMLWWDIKTGCGDLLPPGRQFPQTSTAAVTAASQQCQTDSLPINEFSSSSAAVTGEAIVPQISAQPGDDLLGSLVVPGQQQSAPSPRDGTNELAITATAATTVAPNPSAVVQSAPASVPFSGGAQTLEEVRSHSVSAASKMTWFRAKFNECCNYIDLDRAVLKRGKFEDFAEASRDLRCSLPPIVQFLTPANGASSGRSPNMSDALINEYGLNDSRNSTLRTVLTAVAADNSLRCSKKESIFAPLVKVLAKLEVLVTGSQTATASQGDAAVFVASILSTTTGDIHEKEASRPLFDPRAFL